MTTGVVMMVMIVEGSGEGEGSNFGQMEVRDIGEWERLSFIRILDFLAIEEWQPCTFMCLSFLCDLEFTSIASWTCGEALHTSRISFWPWCS